MIRALFGLMIVMTTLTNSVSATNTTDKLKQFITGINKTFTTRNNTRMFVITVTRISDGKTRKIRKEELNNVLSCISNLCTEKDYTSSITSHLPSCAVGILPLKGDLKTQIRQIHRVYNMKDCAKIIVFNEMFFAQEEPLSFLEQKSIELSLHDLSKKDISLLLCPNFLFLGKNITVSGEDMRSIANKNKDSINDGSMQVNWGYSAAFANKIVATLRSTAATFNITPLINKSICIHNGTTLIEYMKSTYFQESDSDLVDISKNCWYLFGDGNDQLVNENKLSRFLLANISFEICFDLANGIRKKRNKNSKLHILQSNWIDSTDYQNQTNLVDDRLIIHVDPVVTLDHSECDEIRKFGNTLSKQKFDLCAKHLTKKISEFKMEATGSDEIVFVVYEVGFKR